MQTRAKPTRWIDGEIRALYVKEIWNRTQAAIDSCTSFETFLTGTQILAIIMCPNLRKHQDVIRWCLIPLIDHISNDLEDQLITWIGAAYPELRGALDAPRDSAAV